MNAPLLRPDNGGRKQRFHRGPTPESQSMIRKSVKRFSLATNAERVCAEIMLKQ